LHRIPSGFLTWPSLVLSCPVLSYSVQPKQRQQQQQQQQLRLQWQRSAA